MCQYSSNPLFKELMQMTFQSFPMKAHSSPSLQLLPHLHHYPCKHQWNILINCSQKININRPVRHNQNKPGNLTVTTRLKNLMFFFDSLHSLMGSSLQSGQSRALLHTLLISIHSPLRHLNFSGPLHWVTVERLKDTTCQEQSMLTYNIL